jgi:hypothetical protein
MVSVHDQPPNVLCLIDHLTEYEIDVVHIPNYKWVPNFAETI